MNVDFGDNLTVHCVAAEPYATLLRVACNDLGQEVAFETIVLGKLQHGYRVLQMRSMLGTRIELCYLFVHVNIGSPQQNRWPTPRQVRGPAVDPSSL
jgi:hypothetical protein